MLAAAGDREGALAEYRAAFVISKLATADPHNAQGQRDLAVIHQRIGDMLAAAGNRKGARAAYRAAFAIVEKLATADPHNDDRQHDLSVSHNKIGEMLAAADDREGATTFVHPSPSVKNSLPPSPTKQNGSTIWRLVAEYWGNAARWWRQCGRAR